MHCISRLLLLTFAFATVPAENTRRSKFTKSVANHFFRYEAVDELFTIMNHEGETNKFRNNDTTARPGFDRFLRASFQLFLDLLEQAEFNKWPFF